MGYNILDYVTDTLIPQKGLNIEYTVESLALRSTMAYASPDGGYGVVTSIDEKTAKETAQKQLEKAGISPAMAGRVVADGNVSRGEAIELMSSIGQMIHSKNPNLGTPSKDTMDRVNDFAARHHITDKSTIEGLAYFDQFSRTAAKGFYTDVLQPVSDALGKKMPGPETITVADSGIAAGIAGAAAGAVVGGLPGAATGGLFGARLK